MPEILVWSPTVWSNAKNHGLPPPPWSGFEGVIPDFKILPLKWLLSCVFLPSEGLESSGRLVGAASASFNQNPW